MHSIQSYWDFSVSVKTKTGWGYEAFAFEGLPGKSQAVAKENLESLDYAQLGNALKGIQLGQYSQDAVKELGAYLFNWLFRGNLREAFMNQIERLGKETQKKLRIRLCFHPELLNRWELREYLHLESMLVPEWEEEVKEAQQAKRQPKFPLRIRSPFLALNPSIALCRQTLGVPVSPEIAPAEPLRLLVAYYNPPTKPVEYLKPMFEAFMSAIDPLRAVRFVELHDDQILSDPRSEAEPPNKKGILEKLKSTNPHVFVFFGHGHEYGEGGLVLGNGTPTDNLLATELAKTIQEMEYANLRLVVLPNCETNRMAPALLDAGIPAVVAMQKEILDSPVAEALVDAFCNALFDPLRQFKPLEECVFNVRDRIREMRGEGNVHWFIPTLYIQSESGQLFASEEEIRLTQYRRFVQEHYNEFPVTVFVKEGMTLESHYVESKVGEKQEREEKAKEAEGTLGSDVPPSLEEWRLRHGRTMVEPVDRKAQEALKEHPHTVITGEAGDGKSTLLRYLARLYAAENGKGKVKVPILISLRDWAKSGASFEEYLQGRFLSDTGIPQKFGAWLWGKVNASDAVILLDGLDEVADAEDQRKIVAQIQTLSSGGAKDCIIVVTSRKAAYRNQLSEFHTVELLPLKDAQIKDYAQRYFADGEATGATSRQLRGKAKQFIDLLNTDSRSKALAGNGLMLSLMCFLFDQGALQLPSSTDELYEQVTDNLLTATKKLGLPGRTEKVYPPKLKRQVLTEVAFHSLFCGSRDFEPSQEFIDACIERQTEVKTWEKFAGQEEEILEDIVQNSGLLHPVGPPQTAKKYRFFHLTFHEYFAACHIASKVEEERDESFRRWVFEGAELDCSDCKRKLYPFNHYFWHSEWEETVLLVVGVMKDAHLLLRRIKAESQQDDWEKRMLILLAKALSRCQKPEKELAERLSRDLYILYWDSDYLRGKLDNSLSALGRSRVPSHSSTLVMLFRNVHRPTPEFRQRARDLGAVDDLWRIISRGDDLVAAEALCRMGETLCRMGDTSPVEIMMKHLDRRGVDAVNAMARIGDTHTVDALITALKHENKSVRYDAAEALGKIGDSNAVNALIPALKDESKSVRYAAVSALGLIGDTRAVDALLKDLLKDLWDYNPDVRYYAALAIGFIGDANAVDELITVLGGERKYSFLLNGVDVHLGIILQQNRIRSAAAAALGHIGDIRAFDALVNALEASEPIFSVEATQDTIISLDNHTIPNGAFRSKLFRLLINPYPPSLMVLKDVEGSQWSIYYHDDDAYTITKKADQLNVRRTDRTRSNAAYALGKLRDVRAVNPLINALNDEDWWVRMSAAEALGNIGSAHAFDPLINALKDDSSSVRIAAAKALGKIRDVRAVDPLVEALKDKKKYVASNAAEALGDIGDARVLNPLINALKDDNSAVHRSAAEAIGKIGDISAVEALMEAFKERHSEAAAKALGQIGDSRAVNVLVTALKDVYKMPDWKKKVCMAAAEALGKIGDIHAVNALITVLKEEDNDIPTESCVEIRMAVAETLRNISKRHRIRIFPDGRWEELPKME